MFFTLRNSRSPLHQPEAGIKKCGKLRQTGALQLGFGNVRLNPHNLFFEVVLVFEYLIQFTLSRLQFVVQTAKKKFSASQTDLFFALTGHNRRRGQDKAGARTGQGQRKGRGVAERGMAGRTRGEGQRGSGELEAVRRLSCFSRMLSQAWTQEPKP